MSAQHHPAQSPVPVTREELRSILREQGMLEEPTPEMIESAAQATLSTEEVAILMNKTPGMLSDTIDEQRGPKH